MSLSLVATAAFASSLVATVPADAPDLLDLAPDHTAAIARADARPLDAASLDALTGETSVRVATTYFVDRVLAEPGHAAAHRTVTVTADALRIDPGDPGVWTADPAGWTAVLVPGAPGGALDVDGVTRQRTLFDDAGFSVLVASVGADAEVSAQDLGAVVRSLTEEGRRVLLVSADTGSELAAGAVEGLSEEARAAVGWIGLNGAAPTLATPDTIERVQLIAAPQRKDLPVPARRDHRRLSAQGPNDGVTLLADQLVPGALTLPIAAAPGDLAPYTLAAAALVVDRAADAPSDRAVSLRGGATTTR